MRNSLIADLIPKNNMNTQTTQIGIEKLIKVLLLAIKFNSYAYSPVINHMSKTSKQFIYLSVPSHVG